MKTFIYVGGRGNWTDRGCETFLDDATNEVTCFCYHLTNFAVLVVSVCIFLQVHTFKHTISLQDICSRTEDDCQMDSSSTEQIALSAISIVGTALSIIGLVLTIFTLLIFK